MCYIVHVGYCYFQGTRGPGTSKNRRYHGHLVKSPKLRKEGRETVNLRCSCDFHKGNRVLTPRLNRMSIRYYYPCINTPTYASVAFSEGNLDTHRKVFLGKNALSKIRPLLTTDESIEAEHY